MAPDLPAAHCVASSDDLRLMAGRGATVLNCPRVLGRSGRTAAFGRFAGHGIRTAIDIDGYNMDLLGELNAASAISKIAAGRPDVATTPELIDAVSATAAAAVGRPDLGHLAAGATADLTVVDLSHPHLHPLADPRRGLVALANRADVAQLFVDGNLPVDAGRLVASDEGAIRAAGAAAVRRIWDLPEARAALCGA